MDERQVLKAVHRGPFLLGLDVEKDAKPVMELLRHLLDMSNQQVGGWKRRVKVFSASAAGAAGWATQAGRAACAVGLGDACWALASARRRQFGQRSLGAGCGGWQGTLYEAPCVC